MARIEVNLPVGISGDYEIAIYNRETTDKDWGWYLSMPKCSTDESDSWTVLLKEGCPMPIMQNSEAEYNEHQWLWDNAVGDVLIGGLGLGMCHQALIDNPAVTSVTIVEVAQDVVDLVWSHCAKDDTFSIVVADFETWTPPGDASFDTVWGDTWLVDNALLYSQYRVLMTNTYSKYTNNIGFWGNLS